MMSLDNFSVYQTATLIERRAFPPKSLKQTLQVKIPVSIWMHLPVSGKLSNFIYLILMKMENALLYDFKKKSKI